MTSPRLILISGPIASGKTTAALRLSARARLRGELAASIDMDEMVCAIAGNDWSLVRETDRDRSGELAAALTQRLFESGISLVVIAGSTVSPHEWQQVEACFDQRPHTTRVLLRVSLEESIRRVREDPCRVATKVPEIVRRLYSRIDWSTVVPQDIDMLTDGLTIDQVVDAIEHALSGPS